MMDLDSRTSFSSPGTHSRNALTPVAMRLFQQNQPRAAINQPMEKFQTNDLFLKTQLGLPANFAIYSGRELQRKLAHDNAFLSYALEQPNFFAGA